MSQLASCNLIAFVGVTDFKAAKAFYCDLLGLRVISEDGFAVVFDANGIMLRATLVGEASPAPYTVLGWEVHDIDTVARELAHAGVCFQRFPGMEQDDLAIWNAPGGAARIAWFKDPTGNMLSISQHS